MAVLRFRIYGVIDVDAEEGIGDILEQMREQGSADIISVEISPCDDAPLASQDFKKRYSENKKSNLVGR